MRLLGPQHAKRDQPTSRPLTLGRRMTAFAAVLTVVGGVGVVAVASNAPVASSPALAASYPAVHAVRGAGTPSPAPGVTAVPLASVAPIVVAPRSAPTARPAASSSPSVAPHLTTAHASAPPTGTPTTAPAKAMIGSSTGGSVSATQAFFPNMEVVRFYYPGAPTVWGGGIATIRSDQVIFVSFKYDVATTAAGGSDAAFRTVLHSWAASGRQIYWTWQHEADNPNKGISQASYRAGWARLLAVAAEEPAANLHSMSILMGVALNGSHGPVEGWYIPGVDVLGFDSYYLDTELLAQRYAASKHKPVAFPEFGAGISGSPDTTSATFARSFLSALDSNTIAAVWFNNYGNELATHPQTLAILKAAAG